MLKEAPNVQIYEGTSALVMVLAMNTQRPPLDQLRVRRAINAAIDKQTVMDTAYAGGEVVGTFMDVGNPYYVDFTDMYQYDPEAAAAVAADTEFDHELVISVPQNYEPHVRAAELYHEMLRQAGFPVRLQLVEWSTWLSDVYRDSQFDLTVIGHTGKLDPDGRLARYGTADTYVQWEDPPTAEAIREARRGKRSRPPRRTVHDGAGTHGTAVAVCVRRDSLPLRWARRGPSRVRDGQSARHLRSAEPAFRGVG